MKKNYLTIKIVANNEVRNIAFAKGINRSINLGNVEKILAMMKVKGYRKAEQIQVIKAEDVIKTGDISLVDINGQDIKPEDAAKYFLVLDGQHRVIAAALYNEWAAENGKETIDVPAIEVELQGMKPLPNISMRLILLRRNGLPQIMYVVQPILTQTANSCNGITN